MGGGFGFRLEGTTAFNIRNLHGNLNTHTRTVETTQAKITGLYSKSASVHWSQKVLKATPSELREGQSTPVCAGKSGQQNNSNVLFLEKDNSRLESLVNRENRFSNTKWKILPFTTALYHRWKILHSVMYLFKQSKYFFQEMTNSPFKVLDFQATCYMHS